jgi:hypothetical protein
VLRTRKKLHCASLDSTMVTLMEPQPGIMASTSPLSGLSLDTLSLSSLLLELKNWNFEGDSRFERLREWQLECVEKTGPTMADMEDGAGSNEGTGKHCENCIGRWSEVVCFKEQGGLVPGAVTWFCGLLRRWLV